MRWYNFLETLKKIYKVATVCKVIYVQDNKRRE